MVVTGPLADLGVGDFVNVSGIWVSHPVHKKQFKVTRFTQQIPATNEELLLFLSTGAITGIGPHFASALVDTFGDELVTVLDQTPERLLTVSGIGETKLNQIKLSWQAQREQLSFLSFILDKGLDLTIGKRIWREFYSDSFDKCNNNPYQFIGLIQGITFEIADQLAVQNHFLTDVRLQAAIRDVLNHYFKSANVWMAFDAFFKSLKLRLKWDDDVLMERLQSLIFQQELPVVRDDNNQKWVTSADYNQTELSIMDSIDQLIRSPGNFSVDAPKAVEWLLPRLKYTLSTDQIEALEGLLSHSVAILHGGPGTGKTSMLHAYVQVVSKKTDKIICMAPTGKAAKRLAEQIGCRASTIHSMMEYDEKAHTLTPKALDCDVCIIDEMSMVDMHLFLDVMSMIPLGAKLVLVGDPDQLPSIGPGQVFADLLKHSNIPAFELLTNHRQLTHQGITSLAQKVLLNEPLESNLGADLTLINVTHEDELEATIMDLFMHRIINTFSVSMDEVQLLVPIHKGRFGISNLNQQIASQVRTIDAGPNAWVVGDRVIQCRNNYAKRVMNGDIGFIKRQSADDVTIEFQHGSVIFDSTDMADIQLAYAVSIHKFQGSEAPIIILPMIKQWGFFMSMDVLYTAITRAKQHLYIVGDMSVFNTMIVNAKKTNRITRLFQS